MPRKQTTKKETEKPLESLRLSEQLVPKKNETPEQFAERKRALAFEKIEQILMQNVSKTTNKTFTQYTKSLIKQYLQNPYTNRDAIREVSRYLWRVSLLYRKIILYYATMPYYYYNVTYEMDFLKEIDSNKLLKNYQSYLRRMQVIDFPKESVQILATAIRDGAYFGFVYDNEEDGWFSHMLDPKFCRIRGKNIDGQWIVYFDATYFSSGNNVEFVEGVNGDGEGVWDQVFVDGWDAYNQDTTNNRWFMLPPERTICIPANMDDEFDMPLPFFTGIFTSLLDVLDFEQIVADKTVLENYALLVSKIPLIPNSNSIDDFAVSLELVQAMQDLINEAVPSLVGTAYSPMDLEVVTFNNKNQTEDTDAVSTSIKNVFEQSGASQLVVSSGSSTNSVGLKFSIANDASTAFIWVDRLESNLQYIFSQNISEDFIFKFHKITWYNREEYVSEMKEAATLGSSKMDYLTALGMTPYEAYCKLKFEAAIGLGDMMIPLQTSYTQSNNGAGAPEKDETELSEEGMKTKSGGKNAGTKANK